MPSLWEFQVRVDDPRRVGRSDLHWLLSSWLDAPAGQRCVVRPDHDANDKPYALGIFAPVQGLLRVQVAILTDGLPDGLGGDLTGSLSGYLAAGVLSGLEGGASLGARGNRQGFVVVPFSEGGSRAPLRLLADEPWEGLAGAVPARRWRLDFLSPTFFMSDQVGIPYPLPSLVLGSLERRWLRWAPAHLRALGIATVEDRRVAVHTTGFGLEPARGVFARNREAVGFTGFVEHEVRARMRGVEIPEEFPAAAGRLLRLARFTGIGYEPMRGYGVTRYTPIP